MCASFKNAFKKKSVKIPHSVLDVLSEEKLPKGFLYKYIGQGFICITCQNMQITITKDNLEIPSKLKDKDFNEILEYIYLTQDTLKIKGDIEINGIKFNLSELIKKPFEELNITDGVLEIIPEQFKEFELKISCGMLSKRIKVKRQPCEDVERAYFKRIDSDGLDISYIMDNNKNNVDLKIDVDINKCKNIKSVIENLEMAKGFYEGNLSINGKVLNLKNMNYDYDIDVLENMLKFYKWTNQISQMLDIDINPCKDIRVEDVESVYKLYRTLIENRPYKEFCNIDKLSLSTTKRVDSNILTKDNVGAFQFSCNTEFDLLHENISLKTIVVIYNIQISKVEEICISNGFEYELKINNIEGERIYKSIICFKDDESYNTYVSENKNIVNELSTAEELNIDM